MIIAKTFIKCYISLFPTFSNPLTDSVCVYVDNLIAKQRSSYHAAFCRVQSCLALH